MDSDISVFQGPLDAPLSFQSLPLRRVAPMPAQPIIPWTPARVMTAFAVWVMEETYIPAPAQPDA